MSIDELRKYRIQLEQINNISNVINDRGEGIALFDLILTFFVAYLLQIILPQNIKNSIGINDITYYLSLIPLGVIVHIIFQQDTFLNKKLFSKEMNIYQIIFIMILYLFVMSL